MIEERKNAIYIDCNGLTLEQQKQLSSRLQKELDKTIKRNQDSMKYLNESDEHIAWIIYNKHNTRTTRANVWKDAINWYKQKLEKEKL